MQYHTVPRPAAPYPTQPYPTASPRPHTPHRSAAVCSWNEPDLSRVAGVPECVVAGRADPALRKPLFSGSLVRVGASAV